MTLEERWASLFELALGGRLFRTIDTGEVWTISKVRGDGRVQLQGYPPVTGVLDLVVEPDVIRALSDVETAEEKRQREMVTCAKCGAHDIMITTALGGEKSGTRTLKCFRCGAEYELQ